MAAVIKQNGEDKAERTKQERMIGESTEQYYKSRKA
jgi:hypothetical protein